MTMRSLKRQIRSLPTIRGITRGLFNRKYHRKFHGLRIKIIDYYGTVLYHSFIIIHTSNEGGQSPLTTNLIQLFNNAERCVDAFTTDSNDRVFH
jgi:hypothetical protein